MTNDEIMQEILDESVFRKGSLTKTVAFESARGLGAVQDAGAIVVM